MPGILRLEKFGIEQNIKHGANVIVVVKVRLSQSVDGLRVSWRRVRPLGNGRLVGHKEMIHMPRYETRRGLLLAYYVNDLIAVEPTGVSEKFLLSRVVIVFLEFKMLRDSAIGPYRVALRPERHVLGVADCPARKRASRLLDILF